MNLIRKPVFVTSCPDYEADHVKTAMIELLAKNNCLDFIKPGMRIAIKLNLVTAAKPERATTTHPALVKELCQQILDRGGIPILGDSPGGPFSDLYLNRIYKETGMTALSQEMPVQLNHDFQEEYLSFSDAVAMKYFKGTRWLHEADAIINFCKLKTHGMMNLSAAVKNMYGTVPGMTKSEYHFRFSKADEFAHMLLDLNEYWKPALNLVDAVVGMEGNGPTAGTPRHIGAILASESPYELDLVCEKLIGLTSTEVLTTKLAFERNLASEDYQQVQVVGEIKDLVVPDYQLLKNHVSIHFSKGGMVGELASRIIAFFLEASPKVEPKSCIGCGKCQEVCPASAITMKSRKPVINRKACIHCFCCQEFCPKGAMKVKETLIGKL